MTVATQRLFRDLVVHHEGIFHVKEKVKIWNYKLGVTVHFTRTACYRAPLKIAGCPCAIMLLSNLEMCSSIVQTRHTPQQGKNLIAFAPKKAACFLRGNVLPLVCFKKKSVKIVVFLASTFSPRLYCWWKDKNLTSCIDHKLQPWVYHLLTDAGRKTDEQEDSEGTSYLSHILKIIETKGWTQSDDKFSLKGLKDSLRTSASVDWMHSVTKQINLAVESNGSQTDLAMRICVSCIKGYTPFIVIVKYRLYSPVLHKILM